MKLKDLIFVLIKACDDNTENVEVYTEDYEQGELEVTHLEFQMGLYGSKEVIERIIIH